MAKVGIIGAGVMGLAAAHHALKAGHQVQVYEADSQPGGMAAHFDFAGLSIERFYHFICKADRHTFELLEELGIAQTLRWRQTSMGYFINGKHYPWGDPVALLKFPELDLISKFRYGLQMFLATKRNDWSKLDGQSARDWFIAGSGRKAYEVLWRRLFELKFFEFADDVSAAWAWSRIKRVGTSRKSIMQEELGHLDGGSETLVRALVDSIEAKGGSVRVAVPIEEIAVEDGRVAGVRAAGALEACDAVICTIPTPFVARLVPDLPDEWERRYAAIRNIAVVCVVLKLRRSVTPHFWLNINDPAFEVPGIIEFSNLRSLPDTVVYVPYYMPQTHPKFGWDDAKFVEQVFGYIRQLNPAIGDEDLVATYVGRLRFAQPVCERGFAAKLPPVQTPIHGLQIADTSFYYPEDRGISESVRLGREMALALAG